MRKVISFFFISFSFLAIFSNNSQLPQKANQDSMSTLAIIPSADNNKSVIPETKSLSSTSNSTQNSMVVNIVAIAVAIIAVIVALNGQHKSNQVDKIKENFDSFRNYEVKLLQNDIDKLKESIEKERLSTIRLSHILQKHNESLYNSFITIVKENKSFNLSKIIMLNYHINRLYISCLCYDNETATSIDLFDTFSYLKENGRKEDIKHLDYVSQNHPNETNRKLARDVIGNIQGRPDSSVPII